MQLSCSFFRSKRMRRFLDNIGFALFVRKCVGFIFRQEQPASDIDAVFFQLEVEGLAVDAEELACL